MTKYTEPVGFSKLDTFRSCKAKFKYMFIEKRKTAGSPAMERGQAMHENIEAYLNGWVSTLSDDNQKFKEAIDALKAKDYHAEQALGFDRSWNKLPNWFDAETWLRVKMDSYYIEDKHGTAIDFKSGKYRVPSTEQIELYAVALHAMRPELEQVTTAFWFLDTGQEYARTYTAEELIKLRPKYEKYFNAIHAEESWGPEPSVDCRWCDFSKTKGGPCKF